jgi:hypothetical protein
MKPLGTARQSLIRFKEIFLDRAQNALAVKIATRLVLMALVALAATAQGSNVSEYAVKASYLSNFAEFVKWPKKAFADENSPIVLGILGDDPFGSTLDAEIKGKTADGRSLTIKRFSSFDKDQVDDLKNCHILFISESEQDNIREILSSLKGAHMLTVSEIEHFPMMGGMVQFDQEGDIIGLIINPKSAILARLKLGSQLMKIAKLYVDVNVAKAKELYFEGINFYLNGEIVAAIKKWEECLEEDPQFTAAQDKITTARSKLRTISKIK